MTAAAFSKNLFDILGDEDEVRPQTTAPVKEQKKTDAAKPQGKTDKRGPSAKPKDGEARQQRGPRGPRREGAPREGRPQRGRQFDRHSATGIADSEKKEKQGWGHPESAQAEASADTPTAADPASAEKETPIIPEEPEEIVKTLDEYLAEKAAKALKVALPESRKANEGSDDAKWKDSVAFVKVEEPDFFVAKETKTIKKTEKVKKEKVLIEIEQRFQEKARPAFREERRSGPAGGERRGRGNGRRNNAPRQTNGPAVNLQDDSLFPSLGA
ncbi:hypothetical protein CLU79DRAFT_746474 [Phycomyces nitens]|nr:hypothetical protein CLU79DRAFT_746474 [Phycomyces nitens]